MGTFGFELPRQGRQKLFKGEAAIGHDIASKQNAEIIFF